MSKLQQFKSWFSVAEAAKYLSGELKELVTEKDLYQLSIDDNLKISWYVRNLYGALVEPFFLAYERKQPLTEYTDKRFIPNDCTVIKLDGPYTLELQHSAYIKDWIVSLITGTYAGDDNEAPFYLSDQQGRLWQPLSELALPLSQEEYITKRYPREIHPPVSELIILKADLDTCALSLSLANPPSPTTRNPRSEAIDSKIIGILQKILIEGIPCSAPPHNQIGPAENLKNKTQLINALTSYCQGIDGFSKRNLEKRFAEASRSLDEL